MAEPRAAAMVLQLPFADITGRKFCAKATFACASLNYMRAAGLEDIACGGAYGANNRSAADR
jgi:hypothetical protein